MNETLKSSLQLDNKKENIVKISPNLEQKDGDDNKLGSPRDGNFFKVVKTCCEDMNCTKCQEGNAIDSNINLTYDMEEYDKEFQVDESDLNYKEIIDFIEKAKEFGANALDLSKKNLMRIPQNLLDLKHLEVN